MLLQLKMFFAPVSPVQATSWPQVADGCCSEAGLTGCDLSASFSVVRKAQRINQSLTKPCVHKKSLCGMFNVQGDAFAIFSNVNTQRLLFAFHSKCSPFAFTKTKM